MYRFEAVEQYLASITFVLRQTCVWTVKKIRSWWNDCYKATVRSRKLISRKLTFQIFFSHALFNLTERTLGHLNKRYKYLNEHVL